MKALNFLLMFLFSLTFYSQNIKSHQWKNRVLVIYAENKDSEKLQKQINHFYTKNDDFKDRRLVVYLVSKNSYNKGLFQKKWIPIEHKLSKFVSKKGDFKITLLGLDGGIKLKQEEFLSADKLFTIIDGMPMRKRELNSRN